MPSFDSLIGGKPLDGWQGRIKEGAFKSPKGTRIPFAFTEVSRETTKRTTEFSFNSLNDSYIQDNGFGARKYPLTCYFNGRDHDRIATAFEAALLEPGIGNLEHPLFGTFPAIAIGSITRRNDLVSGNNQSVVDVTFSTSLPRVYPAGQSFPKSEILSSLDDFNLAAALAFEENAQLNTIARQAEFKSTVRSVLGTIRSAFADAQGITAAARRDFEEQQRLINEAIDVLVGEPLLLAQALSGLILAPARAVAGYKSRLEGYGLMLQGIIGMFSSSQEDSSSLPETIVAQRNAFFLADFVSLTAVAGSTQSATAASYTTRPQALDAAETVNEQFESSITWRDERIASLSEPVEGSEEGGPGVIIDQGTSYQPLQEAVAQATGFLVESSFQLVPERGVVLARNRTILDVCGELYGSTSNERLDFLITSNDLSGSQILELKRGDLIKYYVA